MCILIANQIRYKQGVAKGMSAAEAAAFVVEEPPAIADHRTKADQKILDTEALIKTAAEHVDMQQRQRTLYHQMKKEAVEARVAPEKITKKAADKA